ncbi:MAG: hypothetical protein P1Q69_00935 [Candidatus Thorarchaeota archaeon]|nr:hypothetical protein [Candidatus Thorarchaeota archaeon]
MDEHIQSRVSTIRSLVQRDSRNSEESFEKLLVALAGVFRLLDGKQSTLVALQGSSTEVQGYILKLLGQIRQQINDSYDCLIEELDKLAERMEKI